MPWEEFVRNAEAQAHPIPTESECAFIKIPRWFTVHSQSLRSTAANYSELLDQLRWKENRLSKLHYCTVCQIEGKVHVLLFFKFLKMIKAKSIYCPEHKKCLRASLVAQWLRVRLPMQGTRVRALVWEDPTCRGATGPVSHDC